MRRIRCAIYTRKSSEEGLDQEFNSLHAQREACEAYVASQRHEGWVLLKAQYDDGGISGGHLDRPSLQRLMADVDAKQVDQIVVYKIDRLTRSLADFAKLVDRLDAAEASFVSVTQSFNTATSMGRLTLNVLLSFAQFEREVTAERIRDKIAASKKKGLWMGGYVPLGYDAAGRTLVINEAEAQTVRKLFNLYAERRAVSIVAREAERMGLRSKLYVTQSGKCPGGNVMSRGHIHKILTNPLYTGRIAHKKQLYEGQHPAIIPPDQWQQVQEILQAQSGIRRGQQNSGRPRASLSGKLFDEEGQPFSPVHTSKAGKRYDYYISKALKDRATPDDKAMGWRLPARVLEARIDWILRKHLRSAIPRGLFADATAQAIQRGLDLLDQKGFEALGLIGRVRIGTGTLGIDLDSTHLATDFDVPEEKLSAEHLRIDTPFTLRRRGVETRMLLDGEAAVRDDVLLRNIAQAHRYLAEVKQGHTVGEIAQTEGLSIKRVQQILKFVFLSPDTVQRIADGRQPAFLTSDWCLNRDIPDSWAEQDQLFSAG